MEKSSLNIKSFRNLLSNQSKNYKISPNNSYHPTEVKLNGLSGGIDDSTSSCNIEDVYSIKRNKADSDCNQRTLADVICGNFVKLFGNYKSGFFLTVLFTPVACSVSVIIIVAAIAGPLWISTEERIPWIAVNNSLYRSNYTVSYIIKSSNASLWLLCTRQALDDNRTKLDFTHKNCTRIDYFAVDNYQSDQRDSTNVIPYTITLSAPLLIISFIILLISYLLFLLAICSHKYKIFYFVAGIGFIISGLLSLSGLIMFISIFKSEIYHKLRPEPSGKESLFSFNYGQSFILYVIGFVVVELSGILNVCLFNKLQKIAQNNQLNNYVKIGLVDVDSSAPAANMCQHRVPFPSIMENGYLPQQRRCSLHSTPNNRKPPTCDGFNNLVSSKHSQQVSQHFDEFNHHASQTPFRRNASTSTLDLVGENNGDVMSGKSNHRAINITKDKSSVSNKLDFNNICGMMRSSSNKSKETNVSENVRRLKPAKNIYYIEERQDEEPNIFIIDPATINKHKKFHQLQKSLEDVRMHKMNNSQAGSTYNSDCDANVGWNFMDRNYYGSRTLPRDFSRRNVRPSLDNLLDNFHQHSSEPERSEPFAYKRCNNQSANNFYPPPPPIGFVYHHSSFDELSRTKPNRNMHCPNVNVHFVDPPLKTQPEQQQYQWPKVIPKSPSSFSMNSFRLQRQPPFSKCPNHKPIDEFDLDKIEHDCRKSNTTLFNESVRSTDFGTAV